MTIAQWKKHCRDQGKVYDGMGDCRDPLPRGRKAASFGMMHSTPSAWRPGAIYYNASKFNTPNLLLDESFKAVANRAAKQASSAAASNFNTPNRLLDESVKAVANRAAKQASAATAAAVVDKVVDKGIVKSVDKGVVKAVDKAVDKAVEEAVEQTVSDVKTAFGRRRVSRRRM